MKDMIGAENTVCGTYDGPAATGDSIVMSCQSPIYGQFVTLQILEEIGTLAVNEVIIWGSK